MAEYVSYFFDDTRQLWALGAVAVLWIAMTAIGHLFVRNDESAFLAPVAGWGVVVATYTVLGTLTELTFTIIAIGLGALAAGAGVVAVRRGSVFFDPIWLRMVLLAAPLLILVSAMQGSQWDEFSHWLTGQAYLLRTDMFPGDGRPVSSASYPAYPYGWQILGYLASRIAGFHVESAAPLLNVLLLLTLARAVIAIVFDAVGKNIHTSGLSPWIIAGCAGISVTLINPTFVQKVILTAYADTATSVCLALGMILGARTIVKMEQSTLSSALRGILVSGLVLGVLVTLKQSTLELFLLGLIGLGFFGVIANFRNLPRVFITVVCIAVPGLILHTLWRVYVADQLAGEEFSFLPYAEWNIDLIPTILTAMGYVLLKKSAYLVAVLIALFLGVRALVQPTFSNRLMLAASVVFVGHICFLFLCYVAVFTGHEARTAASFWRYNQQLGGLAILAISIGVGLLLTWVGARFRIQRAGWVPVILFIVLPLIVAHKLRFDTEPTYTHYRATGMALQDHISRGSMVSVLDPLGSGESGVISRFYVANLEVPVTFMSAFHVTTAKNIGAFISRARGQFLLVHSVTPEAREATGLNLDDNASYLFSVSDEGTLKELAAWPWPKKMRLK